MTLRRLGQGALAAVAALALIPAPAEAARAYTAPAAEQRWSVLPAEQPKLGSRVRFDYKANPGQVISDRVVISNLTSAPMVFRVYAADAYTSLEGAFTVPPGAELAAHAGSWVSLPPKNYKVLPGHPLTLPFVLRVPTNATPGDQAASIVASVTEKQTNADGQLVNVDRRVGTRIYLRVNGPIKPELSVSVDSTHYRQPALLLGGGKLGVTYRIRNTGNSRLLNGSGRVEVTGPLGVDLGTLKTGELPELLPGSEMVKTVQVDGVWPVGALSATTRINAITAEGQLPALNNSADLWATPWFLVVLILAVALVFGVRYGLRLRRRRTVAPPAAAEPS